MKISFNELRRIKHSMPHGSVKLISEKLNISEETVRNYFGAANEKGETVGFHLESGPDGGIVELDDTTIYDLAIEIIAKSHEK